MVMRIRLRLRLWRYKFLKRFTLVVLNVGTAMVDWAARYRKIHRLNDSIIESRYAQSESRY